MKNLRHRLLSRLLTASGCYFLFTDGLGNFGEMEPPAFNAPLYIFTADQTVDESFLQNLVQRSGGAVGPLRRLNDVQALRAIAMKPFTFTGVTTPTSGDVECFPKTAPVPQGRLIVAGRLKAPAAKLTLNYGAAGKSLVRLPVSLVQADAVRGDLLRRYWAQKN